MAYLNITNEPDLIAAMFASDMTFSQFESRICGELVNMDGEVSFLSNGNKTGRVYDFLKETYLDIKFNTRLINQKNWQTNEVHVHKSHQIEISGGTFCGRLEFQMPNLWSERLADDEFSPASAKIMLDRAINFSFRELHIRIQKRGYLK